MDVLEIEVEALSSPALQEENENEFVNKQLVSQMFDCLDGGDFERALLLEWGRRDKYTGVKLAGKGKKDEKYVKRVFEYLSREDVAKLLYICRFCSYLGGPGFPDLIVLGHEWELRFTSKELPLESKLFAILAKEFGFSNIRIARAVPEGSGKKYQPLKINVKEFLNSLFKEKRFLHYLEALEDLIKGERERLEGLSGEKEILQCKDEIKYLEEQREEMPFFLIKKWSAEGVRQEDIFAHMKRLDEIGRNRSQNMEKCLQELKEDNSFKNLSGGVDEDSLKRKRQYIMDGFNIGVSRAEEILKRVWVW